MGKIIKFQTKNENHKPSEDISSNNIRQFGLTSFEEKLRKAVEDYILSVFAVKTVFGMDIIYKKNKSSIGVIGKLAYEHKRKPGLFVADFISEVIDENGNIRVIEVAFKEGEPALYKQIVNTLKAKNALPENQL